MAHQQHRIIYDLYALFESSDRQILRTFDLTTTQYAVLLLLDADYGQRLTDLSTRMVCERSTITRIVDRLERAGLVRRVPDMIDRRSARAVLTRAGVERRADAYAAHARMLERRLSALSETEQHQLAHLLEKLRTGLRQEL
ncbi:MAG: MarR family transcriptional regulator [Chloroflexaceae bacterium]|nr:MarR family transcriptional regulator [Chloroflexaceae bacterium]